MSRKLIKEAESKGYSINEYVKLMRKHKHQNNINQQNPNNKTN